MATENDKILTFQARAQRRACVVPVWFCLFIAGHFISAFSRMKMLSGEARSERYINSSHADQFAEIVASRYSDDLEAAITAVVDLHGKKKT